MTLQKSKQGDHIIYDDGKIKKASHNYANSKII